VFICILLGFPATQRGQLASEVPPLGDDPVLRGLVRGEAGEHRRPRIEVIDRWYSRRWGPGKRQGNAVRRRCACNADSDSGGYFVVVFARPG